MGLSKHGVIEAQRAAELLADIHIDVAFTSCLQRAQYTLNEVLGCNRKCTGFQYRNDHRSNWYESHLPAEDDRSTLQVNVTESLNERYYGELQGMDKLYANRLYGTEQVLLWRRSFKSRPPGGESLEMTAARTLPYYKSTIVPHLRAGESVLICAHGNSLRSIVMFIEQLTEEQIAHREIETGVPLVYVFDSDLNVLEKRKIQAPQGRT